MVTKYMFEKIRKLVNEGQNDAEIARRLQMDRKTVRKYRLSNTPPRYSPRSSPTRVDPFAPFAERAKALADSNDELTATEIFLLLKEDGYGGCERTVQRRIAEIRGQRAKERFFEQEYQPGEQSQFDFKESLELPFVGGARICNLHFGTLPHSDKFFIRAYPFKNFEAFIDGCHSFFEHIGGLTENIRIDNLSPCVSKVLKASKRQYTNSFQKSIDYYGYKVLPCRPAKGSDKGDVEREIRTQARRIRNLIKLTGKIFQNWDDLNDWLREFCKKHETDKSRDLFKDEQDSLRPLPPRDEEILCHVDTIRGSPHGTVRIERCKASYSIPDTAIGKWCRVVISPFDVKIYEKSSHTPIIAIHERLPEEVPSILLEHVLPSLVRKPAAMIRWSHREILFPLPQFRRYYAFLQKRFPECAERQFLQGINLIQYVTINEISLAMELVMESDSHDPFDDLKRILLTDGHRPNHQEHLNQKKLSPRLSMYDSLIPNLQGETAS